MQDNNTMTCRVLSMREGGRHPVQEVLLTARIPVTRRSCIKYAKLQSVQRPSLFFTVQTWIPRLGQWMNPDVIYRGHTLGESSQVYQTHAYPKGEVQC